MLIASASLLPQAIHFTRATDFPARDRAPIIRIVAFPAKINIECLCHPARQIPISAHIHLGSFALQVGPFIITGVANHNPLPGYLSRHRLIHRKKELNRIICPYGHIILYADVYSVSLLTSVSRTGIILTLASISSVSVSPWVRISSAELLNGTRSKLLNALVFLKILSELLPTPPKVWSKTALKGRVPH